MIKVTELFLLNPPIPNLWGKDEWAFTTNECQHSSWGEWRPLRYVQSLDGRGGKVEAVLKERTCNCCTMPQHDWFTDVPTDTQDA